MCETKVWANSIQQSLAHLSIKITYKESSMWNKNDKKTSVKDSSFGFLYRLGHK